MNKAITLFSAALACGMALAGNPVTSSGSFVEGTWVGTAYVTPTMSQVIDGNSVLLTSTAPNGYKMDSWYSTFNGAISTSGDVSQWAVLAGAVDSVNVDTYNTVLAQYKPRYVAVGLKYARISLKFDANGGSGTAPSTQSNLTIKDNVVLPDAALTRVGYTFGNTGLVWTNATGATFFAESTINEEKWTGPLGVAHADTNITLYAKWVANTYTAKIVGQTTEVKTCSYDEEFSVPNPVRSGYVFNGWELMNADKTTAVSNVVDGVTKFKNLTPVKGAEVTLNAKWTARITKVTFNHGGADTGKTGTTSMNIQYGFNPDSIDVPFKTGYIFQGYSNGAVQYWKADGSPVKAWDVDADNFTVDAQWKAVEYRVSYDANGGEGFIADGSYSVDVPSAVSNGEGFKRKNYLLIGWAKNPANPNPDFAPGAAAVLTDVGGCTLYAVWKLRTYYVDFDKNGAYADGTYGSAAMAQLTKNYDDEFALPANTFKAGGLYAFGGWTDEVNGAVYADGATVSNLCAVIGGTNTLVAIWTEQVSELSQAAGCDNLNLYNGDTTTGTEITDPAELESKSTWGLNGDGEVSNEVDTTKPGGVAGLDSSSFAGDGTATIVWQAPAKIGAADTDTSIRIRVLPDDTTGTVYTWNDTDGDGISTISIPMAYDHEVQLTIENSSWYDGTEVVIKSIEWAPVNCYTLKFDANGGAGAPADVKLECGKQTKLPDFTGTVKPDCDFMGWSTSNTATEAEFRAGGLFGDDLAVKDDIDTLYAVWKLPTPIPVPVAKTGLIYNGNEQVGVDSANGYVLSGVWKASAAGDYTAIATPKAGFIWDDGTKVAKDISWSISKAPYDMSGVVFADAELVYNGAEQSLVLIDPATLPAGVTVAYEGSTSGVNVGSYTAIAKFTGDSDHAPIADKTATLTIKKAVYDMSGVAFADASFTHVEGETYSLAITGTLPAGVTVAYVGNGQSAIGDYVVTAKFAGDAANYEAIADMTAKLSIVEGPAPKFAPDLYPTDPTEFAAVLATTYVGWLRKDGEIAGSLTIKAAKANKKTGASKLTISATPMGGKKVTIKATATAGKKTADGAEGLIINGDSIGGTLTVNGIVYDVQAGANFLLLKDRKAEAKGKLPVGTWTFAVNNSMDGSVFAVGSIKIGTTGKGKLTANLADGTKVSINQLGVFGRGALGYEYGTFAIPYVYAKKGVNFGFVLWINADGTCWLSDMTLDGAEVIGPSSLVAPTAGSYLFEASVPASYLADASGVNVSPNGQAFSFDGAKFTLPKTVGTVAANGGVAVVNPAGAAYDNVSALKLKYAAKTGVMSGSFKLYSLIDGRVASMAMTVAGVAVNGEFAGVAYNKAKKFGIAVGAAPKK